MQVKVVKGNARSDTRSSLLSRALGPAHRQTWRKCPQEVCQWKVGAWFWVFASVEALALAETNPFPLQIALAAAAAESFLVFFSSPILLLCS